MPSTSGSSWHYHLHSAGPGRNNHPRSKKTHLMTMRSRSPEWGQYNYNEENVNKSLQCEVEFHHSLGSRTRYKIFEELLCGRSYPYLSGLLSVLAHSWWCGGADRETGPSASGSRTRCYCCHIATR